MRHLISSFFVHRFIQANNQESKVYGARLGPTGPRWAPCWPHDPCYLGTENTSKFYSNGLLCWESSNNCWIASTKGRNVESVSTSQHHQQKEKQTKTMYISHVSQYAQEWRHHTGMLSVLMTELKITYICVHVIGYMLVAKSPRTLTAPKQLFKLFHEFAKLLTSLFIIDIYFSYFLYYSLS